MLTMANTYRSWGGIQCGNLTYNSHWIEFQEETLLGADYWLQRSSKIPKFPMHLTLA